MSDIFFENVSDESLKAQIRKTERSWFAAGRLLDFKCPRCGASYVNMADDCIAALDDPCPGFQAMEKAYKEYENNRSAIVGEK